PDEYGYTAVHLAAQHQGIESLEWIKRQIGTDCFRLKGLLDRTAFHFAAKKSDNSNLKWLVKELGSDCLTVPDEDGDTAVHLAAQHQGIESLEWIKRQIGTDCFRLKEESSAATVSQFLTNTVTRPSIWAAQHQGIESLEWIKRQIGTDCFRLKTKSDRTAFHFAAKKSDNSNLKWLVKELGSDCLTVPDSLGDTAVHLAAKHQGIESLETAFHFAAEKSDNSNLKWLVKELGSDCLTVPDKDGDTAVHLAAEWQPVDSLQFIFDQIGAEMFSLKNNKGETPADLVDIGGGHRQVSKAGLDFLHAAAARSLSASRWQLSADCRLSWRQEAAGPQLHRLDFILQDNNKKQLIGRGGFGKVYKALTDRNQTVAVKRAVEMEKRGVEILKRLSHPNILQFLKFEQKSDGLYIFTELVSGHSLFELMQRQNKPFKESGGLNFLHCQPEGAILHRDVNSKNVMLSNEGVIKLIDFGLAKEIGKSSGPEHRHRPKGTTYFMAPELFDTEVHSLPYSAKTDMWAFGCTVYELTAMQPPDGDRPRSKICLGLRTGFSAGLKDFYLRCVDYDPRKRADTAELLRHSFLSASS
uniref:Protein kinase domain-containing protein n=1 Tax=Macrostomum lignano TaxID=282301 RepID=A0A1I8FGY2_9PLAT